MTNTINIIIPIYTLSITSSEWRSLDRCFEVFEEKYEITFVAPESLDMSMLHDKYSCFNVERFADNYFISVQSYNKLVLSTEFYARFLQWKYILIFQTDCYIFCDQLDYWCSAGYDYVGAPWISKLRSVKWWYKPVIFVKRLLGSGFAKQLSVGNGGLSLRSTEHFYNLSIDMRQRIEYYIDRCDNPRYNEDVFWSCEPNRQVKRLNIPDYRTALRFAFDDFPEVAYTLNSNKLPMGCHGWNKDQNNKFWSKFIKL